MAAYLSVFRLSRGIPYLVKKAVSHHRSGLSVCEVEEITKYPEFSDRRYGGLDP